jgi:hypothetical protein
MRSETLVALCLVLCSLAAVAESGTQNDPEAGWVSLFDGTSLKDWKAAEENPDSFKLVDGQLLADGGRSHIYYVGPVADHDFKNFELKLEVKTTKGSNSGVYFHTAYGKQGWPPKGHEAQVNSTHTDWRRTGSLYAVRDVRKPFSKDDEWFSYHIKVEGQHIVIKVDGETTVDYVEPEGLTRKERPDGEMIDRGTFALQAHDPKSLTYYRNIRVKVLPE